MASMIIKHHFCWWRQTKVWDHTPFSPGQKWRRYWGSVWHLKENSIPLFQGAWNRGKIIMYSTAHLSRRWEEGRFRSVKCISFNHHLKCEQILESSVLKIENCFGRLEWWKSFCSCNKKVENRSELTPHCNKNTWCWGWKISLVAPQRIAVQNEEFAGPL